MEKRNDIKQKENVYETIEKHRQIIFDEKIWIKQEMWKIAEVTYSYTNFIPQGENESDEEYKENKKELEIDGKNILINTTLFCNLGELDLTNFDKLKDEQKRKKIINAKNSLTKHIYDKFYYISKALKELNSLEPKNDIEKYYLEIFINSLKEKLDLLEYCLNGIPYELEKAGININFSEEKRKEIDEKQKKLDEKLFGGEVQNNQEEVIKCYEHIYSNYQKNKGKFSAKEDKRFKYFLSKIEAKLPDDYEYKPKEKLNNLLSKYEGVKLPNKEYILGFNLFVEALDKLKHVIKRDPNAKSVCDGPNGVLFPTSKEFEYIALKRFFTLNTHEIEVHSTTDHNNEQLIGNTRGAGSTIKDEGLAILMESLLQYGKQLFKIDEKTGKTIIDKNKISISNAFTFILMGELLDNDELLEFLELNHKLQPDIISPIDRYNRLKRSNCNGIQHKDTSYIRGLFQAVDEINKNILSDGKDGTSIEDLFLGKVGFDEIYKLKAIKEEKERNGEKLNIVTPIFSSESIIFSIEQELKGEKVNKEGFLEYLQDKYPIFDFSQEQINTISKKTKQNIAGVTNIAMRNITENNLRSMTTKNKQLSTLLNIIHIHHGKTIGRAYKKMHPDRKKAA